MKEQPQKKWNTYPKGADRVDGPHVVIAATRDEARKKGAEFWGRREEEVTASPRKSR